MTYSPADLLAVRLYLLTSTGLSGDAVGIVGDPDHISTGGYHVGNDDLARIGRLSSDYSKRESTRDRPGTNGASALDIGDFVKGAVSLRTVSLGLVAACQRGDPRTGDIREVIYTPDGATVRRFDRLGLRSTGDGSHLFHTHVSFFRDSEGRRAQPDNFLGLLRELIEGTTTGGDDDMGSSWTEPLTQGEPGFAGHQRDTALAGAWRYAYSAADGVTKLLAAAAEEKVRDAAERVVIDAMARAIGAAGGSVDTAAILAGVDQAVAREVGPLRALVEELQKQVAERDRRLAEAYAAAAALAPDAGAGRA